MTHKVFAGALAAGLALHVGAVFAGIEADFSKETGKIRPELHSSGFGPTICSLTQQALDDIKSMGFAYARTHIFPLMHLDAKDPRNYVFGPTDYLLKRTREEAGLDIFFRLGTSIEHSGPKVHFNSLIPEDFDKMAEIFAGIVRHYNRGWANGHKWNIKYWEIWNEPDGINNMWCLPDGDGVWSVWGCGTPEQVAKDKKRQALFIELFVKTLKRLKSEFGDEIKVGGPALCSATENWFRPILKACKDAGIAPDFVSWHGYSDNPLQYAQDAARMRKVCDEYGFVNCELILNEWHYFGYKDYSWGDMQRCSDPKVKARIWTGPRSHNGIHSACFTLATLANLQRSKLSQAYYYGCHHVGSWGFKDASQVKYKVFYALKMFGDLVKNYPTICASTSEGPYTTLAVKSADGAKKALLVVDYGGQQDKIAVGVKGVAPDARARATILDYTHDLETRAVALRDGVVDWKKNDANSAAALFEFE